MVIGISASGRTPYVVAAVAYARALVELETLAGRAPQMAVAATGGSLLDRVKRLLYVERGTRRNPDTGLAAILVVLALATAWFCAQPVLHAASRAGAPETGLAHGVKRSGQAAPEPRQTAATPAASVQKATAPAAHEQGGASIDEIAAGAYPARSAE